MAEQENNPHSEATKWFLITVAGVVLYVVASFGFVTNQDVEPTTDQVVAPGGAEHD